MLLICDQISILAAKKSVTKFRGAALAERKNPKVKKKQKIPKIPSFLPRLSKLLKMCDPIYTDCSYMFVLT